MEYHTRLYVSVQNNIFIFQILITFVPTKYIYIHEKEFIYQFVFIIWIDIQS